MASKETDAQKWLRCNRCFKQLGKTFFLTCCSHVFCDVCLAYARAKKECPQCRNNDLRTMPIADALKAKEIKHCFESVEEPFEKLQQAFMFQKRQLLLNSARLHDIEKKCFKYKEHCQRILKENKTVKEENAKLRAKLNELAKENKEFKAIKPETVTYMLTPYPHSEGPSQQICQNPRFGSTRFQAHIISPRHLEQQISPRAPIRVLSQQNAEFLVPVASRIPRSLGSSTRSSSIPSSRATPFTNDTPNSQINSINSMN